MRQPKTHFEQIPVEKVTKIAEPLPEDNTVEDGGADDQTHTESISPAGDWREMALKVQEEHDPKRMIGLVQQLIATLDDEQQRKNQPRQPPYK